MQPKIQKIQKKKYYKLKFRIVGKSDKTSTWEYELDTSVRFLHNWIKQDPHTLIIMFSFQKFSVAWDALTYWRNESFTIRYEVDFTSPLPPVESKTSPTTMKTTISHAGTDDLSYRPNNNCSLEYCSDKDGSGRNSHYVNQY